MGCGVSTYCNCCTGGTTWRPPWSAACGSKKKKRYVHGSPCSCSPALPSYTFQVFFPCTGYIVLVLVLLYINNESSSSVIQCPLPFLLEHYRTCYTPSSSSDIISQHSHTSTPFSSCPPPPPPPFLFRIRDLHDGTLPTLYHVLKGRLHQHQLG